jgi:hypothetical protein
MKYTMLSLILVFFSTIVTAQFTDGLRAEFNRCKEKAMTLDMKDPNISKRYNDILQGLLNKAKSGPSPDLALVNDIKDEIRQFGFVVPGEWWTGDWEIEYQKGKTLPRVYRFTGTEMIIVDPKTGKQSGHSALSFENNGARIRTVNDGKLFIITKQGNTRLELKRFAVAREDKEQGFEVWIGTRVPTTKVVLK